MITYTFEYSPERNEVRGYRKENKGNDSKFRT